MKTLFVQIKCELGKAYDVAAYIVDEIIEAQIYSTSGQYDLIGVFNLDDSVDPGVFVNKRLHTVPGLAETNTIIAFNAFTPAGR